MAYVDALYQRNFIEYASYVIKDRAIPHIDDGLKPVQRRILHSLWEMDDGKFHKVANVVGNTMKLHPHGDQSIPSSLVVLANRDLFIDKQGNFGNIYTGDDAAAARYIECRLTPLAREVLFNPEITQFQDSYDSRNREPVVLPAKIPVLLALGAEGIAVGMATRILPHNLAELLEAEIACLEGRPFQVYPDFLTGGQVDVSEYNDGNGKVLVRAALDTSDPKRIVIRAIPYGTTTESLIASIEEAARKGKVKVASISDFTAENVEIELKLARGVYTQEVVDALYAFTDCELSISANLTLINRDNRPQQMPASEVLQHNAQRLVGLLEAELRLEDQQLRDRLHARTLERIFIEERIYQRIEDQNTAEKVTQAVRAGLAEHQAEIGREVTNDDIEALLKIPIRRISLYDIERARREMREIEARLNEVAAHLQALVPYAVALLQRLLAKYGPQFPRRSVLTSFRKVDVREAARRDLKLRYDRNTGYLGYEVATGQALFDVSQYDRVLVIRKEATYSVIDVPDKLFIGKGMLHCGRVDKDLVFNLIWRDDEGATYLKRCQIEQFILNRQYALVPEGARSIRLTTDSERKLVLQYKPKPRVRVLEEEFALADYPVRGAKTQGVRLSTKETESCRFA
jgi:topoisomerase-4 subunit A